MFQAPQDATRFSWRHVWHSSTHGSRDDGFTLLIKGSCPRLYIVSAGLSRNLPDDDFQRLPIWASLHVFYVLVCEVRHGLPQCCYSLRLKLCLVQEQLLGVGAAKSARTTTVAGSTKITEQIKLILHN